MKFSAAVVATALLAGVQASNVTYVTKVVPSITTYCPGPTTITHGTKTYTVTSATTLTITDCPCTITSPVMTATVSQCHDCQAPTPKPPVYNTTSTSYVKPPPAPTSNGTVPTYSPLPGSASRATAAGGFAAALLGLVAYAL